MQSERLHKYVHNVVNCNDFLYNANVLYDCGFFKCLTRNMTKTLPTADK